MPDDPHAQARQHLEILSILTFVIAGLSTLVLLGIGGFVVGPFGGHMGFAETSILGLVLIPLLGLVVLYIATAIGLRKRRSWAKTTGIIASALSLLSFPLGTAYGVYGLYVLTRSDVGALLTASA